MEEAGASEIFSVIGDRIFGDNAFRDPDVPRPLLKDELTKFISSVLAHVWNNMRKKVASQYDQLQRGKTDVKTEFNSA